MDTEPTRPIKWHFKYFVHKISIIILYSLKTIDNCFGIQKTPEAGTEILDWMIEEHINRAITPKVFFLLSSSKQR